MAVATQPWLAGTAEEGGTDIETVLNQMVDGLAIPLRRAGTAAERFRQSDAVPDIILDREFRLTQAGDESP
jgi:hypothetical protein